MQEPSQAQSGFRTDTLTRLHMAGWTLARVSEYPGHSGRPRLVAQVDLPLHNPLVRWVKHRNPARRRQLVYRHARLAYCQAASRVQDPWLQCFPVRLDRARSGAGMPGGIADAIFLGWFPATCLYWWSVRALPPAGWEYSPAGKHWRLVTGPVGLWSSADFAGWAGALLALDGRSRTMFWRSLAELLGLPDRGDREGKVGNLIEAWTWECLGRIPPKLREWTDPVYRNRLEIGTRPSEGALQVHPDPSWYFELVT